MPQDCGKGELGRWGGPKANPSPGPPSPSPVHHTSGPPTEPRVWSMPGLSDPRGLWPLPSLPSPSPPWSQAPVEVHPAALPTSESGWRGRCWWGQGWGRAHSAIKLATASSQPGLAHLMSSFLLSPTLTFLALPTCPCLPASCPSPASPPSAMSTTPSPSCGSPCCECPIPLCLSVPRMLSAFLGGGGWEGRVLCLPGATMPKLIYIFGFLLG